MTKFAYKRRFKSSVRKLKNKYGVTSAAPSAVPTQIQRVVLSAKEDESMRALEAEIAQIGAASQRNAQDQDTLSADSQRLAAEIERAFKAMRSTLNEREKALTARLWDKTKNQMAALKAQQAKLEKYADSAKHALSEQNRLILDASVILDESTEHW